MSGPLLETKLHVPIRRRQLVPRPRVTDLLDRTWDSRLALVSAPAGFGKTTLLTTWLADAPPGVAAWLSLDERDNDPAVFWTYVRAALGSVAPGVRGGPPPSVEAPGVPTDADLTTLLNDLGAVGDDLVLVLDDYHVIDAREVLDGMTFLVENLPPRVHLVIAARADPALPLARLRARGELVEIRAADLRFTPVEAATYLNGTMGLALTAPDIATLEERTEGWIAALQLAALSMQGRQDTAGFIADFAGEDRFIVDYLAEEVLLRQPAPVRRFLLETSILGRLTASLCDAVTGQDGGRARLDALERGNLFLVPLDDRRGWYRYHHLFADVLRARLLDEDPGRVRVLHRRASDWFEQHGDRPEAIGHALAAEDFERAADLVELAIPAMRRLRQEATLRGWLERLPDELFPVRPVLSVGYAASLMVHGEVEGVEARLRDAERWLPALPAGSRESVPPSPPMVVVDQEAFAGLPTAIAVYRAGQARVRGDVARTLAHAGRALELAGPDDHVGRGAAAALLGLAHWTSGDLDAGHRRYTEAMASFERIGHHSDMLGCAVVLADIRVEQGRLGEALRTYERGLHLAGQADPVVRGAADMHVGMSEILRERNDLHAALRHLEASRELGERAGLPRNPYRWRVALARLRQADGDLDGALDLLDDAEHRYVADFLPDVRPVAALRTRVRIAQGAVDDALEWARRRRLGVEDDLTYLREHEHVTLSRVLLAQAARDGSRRSLDGATGLLDRLLSAAEEGGRTGSVLEILVLQALAHAARGDVPAALAPLRRAVRLAAPEGHVRVFLDEGPAMVALLTEAARHGDVRSEARRLVLAARHAERHDPVERHDPAQRRDAVERQAPVEPLSRRELEVLRLLRSDLDGPDIARELVVSLSTVRTHTRSIYAKLGVTSRRAAVRRADDLGLLTSTGRG